MPKQINRRAILGGSLAAGAAWALPARAIAAVPALASTLSPYERRVFQVATRERDRVADKLWKRNIVGIADFAQPSWKPRFHIANLEDGSIRSYLIAHGKGSDPQHDGWLKSFSKVHGSEATSRGAYLTCEWYKGKYGTSVRLEGMDQDNSTALDRAIVMHPAWYAEKAMVSKWGKLGRSQGCFALGDDAFLDTLWRLSGGCLLFADKIGEA